MYPYTAINLKESTSNNIKDFLSLVDIYGLSHMMMFTNTEKNSYLRLAKMPKGPTITFKIKSYCLSSDIFRSSEHNKKPLTKNFDHIPIIIMNGFNSTNISEKYETPLKTISMMFQSFFPPLNLTEIQMKKCKRVVLLNLNNENNEEPELLFRHYDIDIEKFSIKKTISNLINTIGINKDLSKFDNIADYVLKQSGYTDQSDTDNNMGECDIIIDKNLKEEKIKIKLREIGPRLNLTLHKIEEGFLKGNVIFHSLINKSKKEIKEIKMKLKKKKQKKKEKNNNEKINLSSNNINPNDNKNIGKNENPRNNKSQSKEHKKQHYHSKSHYNEKKNLEEQINKNNNSNYQKDNLNNLNNNNIINNKNYNNDNISIKREDNSRYNQNNNKNIPIQKIPENNQSKNEKNKIVNENNSNQIHKNRFDENISNDMNNSRNIKDLNNIIRILDKKTPPKLPNKLKRDNSGSYNDSFNKADSKNKSKIIEKSDNIDNKNIIEKNNKFYFIFKNTNLNQIYINLKITFTNSINNFWYYHLKEKIIPKFFDDKYYFYFNQFALNIIKKDKSNDPNYIKIGKWIHNNINYNENYSKKILNPLEILAFREGICDHFVLLYITLLNSIDIKCIRIGGYACSENKKIKNLNINENGHSWVLAYINNNWIPLDATWGIYGNKFPVSHIFEFFINGSTISESSDDIERCGINKKMEFIEDE
jgi:ribosome biogenesis protein SSF1/2